jgi:hypothetical protein
LAQRQLAAGREVTATRLPQGADLDYLAIRAAIDARVKHHRKEKGRWVLEYFQLDAFSERMLRIAVTQEQTAIAMAELELGVRRRV